MFGNPEFLAERLIDQHEEGQLDDAEFYRRWADLAQQADWMCVAGQKPEGELILTTWSAWLKDSLELLEDSLKALQSSLEVLDSPKESKRDKIII